MTILQALILGSLQGLTEFIPISSSAHLWLAHRFLGVQEIDGTAFDIVLHLGTLVALVGYFHADLRSMGVEAWRVVRRLPPRNAADRALLVPIIVGTIPGALMGLFLMEYTETLVSPLLIGCTMLLAAAIFTLSERFRGTRTAVTTGDAVLVGIAQGVAGLFHGFSRSGLTISTGKGVGLDRSTAARFSFLLSLPIILAAGAKTLLDVSQGTVVLPGAAQVAVGFLSSAVLGYLAVRFLISYLRRHSLVVFAVYMGCVGATLVVLSLAGVI